MKKAKRKAIATLSLSRLRLITDHFDLDVGDRRLAANHVEALVARADFAEVLALLRRDELKIICKTLKVPGHGRAREAIAERVVQSFKWNDEGQPTSSETSSRPAPSRPAPETLARWREHGSSGLIARYEQSRERELSGSPRVTSKPQIDLALLFDSQRYEVRKLLDRGLKAETLEEAKEVFEDLVLRFTFSGRSHEIRAILARAAAESGSRGKPARKARTTKVKARKKRQRG